MQDIVLVIHLQKYLFKLQVIFFEHNYIHIVIPRYEALMSGSAKKRAGTEPPAYAVAVAYLRQSLKHSRQLRLRTTQSRPFRVVH